MLYNDITNYYSTNYKIQLHRLSCFGPKMARWSQYHQSADDGVCHSLWLHLCQALLPTWSLQRWYHWNRQLWRISVWKGQIVSVEAQKYNDSLAISTHNFKKSWYNIQRLPELDSANKMDSQSKIIAPTHVLLPSTPALNPSNQTPIFQNPSNPPYFSVPTLLPTSNFSKSIKSSSFSCANSTALCWDRS